MSSLHKKWFTCSLAFSSSSFLVKPMANVRRLLKFANRAPAPHVSRARRRAPIPRQKILLGTRDSTSRSFDVFHPRRRFTQSTTSAHMHIEERKWEETQMGITVWCKSTVCKSFSIDPMPLCMRIESKITDIAHAGVEDADTFQHHFKSLLSPF